MPLFFDPDYYLPILNGLIGDKLAKVSDKWAIKMSFRIGGRDVPLSMLDGWVRGRNTIVFVHGLMADEKIFKHFASLEKRYSVLYIRYNTGLHIYENGLQLATLLNQLYERYRMKKLYLAGHSMGGLVVRSACHQAAKLRQPWVNHLSSVFLIAVPNDGAGLEKVGHVTAATLNRLAKWHLGVIGNVLEQRSNGIKDLRLASMLEEDHTGAPSADGRRTPVPPIPGVDYHILVGTLTSDEDSLMGKYFGDGLVTPKSAVGVTLLKSSTVKIFFKTGHNSILSNPEVIQYIRDVLRRG